MRKAAFIIFVAIFLYLGIAWTNFITTPLIPPGTTLTYDFNRGSSIRTLAADLHAKGLLAHPGFLITLACFKGVIRHMHAGEYLFESGITPSQLLEQMAAGRSISHRFTIVEGWTFNQLLAALRADPGLRHTSEGLSAVALLHTLGAPLKYPEGLFFPATYYFNKGMTDIDILKMAYQKMMRKLMAAWQQRAPDLLYRSPYDALIAASLIEKETAQPQERPIIAGIIMRRLRLGMPLQIDATLIYGLGDQYAGRLNSAALRQDTPYNTYLHTGLPPTPIAMPSGHAIEAALHPDNSHILYFVARGNGTHQFSATLQQQDKAVLTYQINKSPFNFGRRPNQRNCSWYWYNETFIQKICSLL